MKRYLIRQFGRPRGLAGRLAGTVMSLKNRERIEWAIDRLDIAYNSRVLEVGFGPGVAVAGLAARTPEGFIAGVDPSAVMLRQAARRNRVPISEGRVELRRGSVGSLAYPDGWFDLAVAINSHMFWPDLRAGLIEVRRVLRPGGVFALVFQPPFGLRDGDIETRARSLADEICRSRFAEARSCVETLTRGSTICIEAIVAAAPANRSSGVQRAGEADSKLVGLSGSPDPLYTAMRG